MIKEKTGTVVGGVFLSIGVNVFATAALTLLVLANSILNLDFYKGLITDKQNNSKLYEAFEEAWNEDRDAGMLTMVLPGEADISNADIEDFITEEFFQTVMSDYIDAVFDEDCDIDEDYYYDYYYETMIPAMEDASGIELSRQERKDYAQQVTDETIKALKEDATEILNDDDREILGNLDKSKNSVLMMAYASIVLALAMAGIMVAVYKSKYRALRNTSIALLVMGICELFSFIGMKALYSAVVSEIAVDSDTAAYIVDYIRAIGSNSLNKPVVISLIITVLSIAGIVIFSILRKTEGPLEIE